MMIQNKIASLLIILICLSGCAKSTHLQYTPFVKNLDGKNELHISTYPAGFAQTNSSIPYLYESRTTPKKVYFEVFVRDAVKKYGQNLNVKSIRIHSFSVQIDNQSKITLISNYESNFWMQDNTRHNPLNLTPIPYDENASLLIDIAFTLNGQDYSFKGKMEPTKKVSVFPLFLQYL